MGPKADQTKLENQYSELLMEANDLTEDLKETFELGQLLESKPEKANLFAARISRLDDCFHKLRRVVNSAHVIAETLDNKQGMEHLVQLRVVSREYYYQSLAKSSSEIIARANFDGSDSHNSVMSRRSENTNILIKLPPINIPSYDGDISNWISFKDTFSSLVHENSDLSSVQKFHYLKSALKGSAAQTISAITTSEGGYIQAWECLTKRYDNKRLLASNYLLKIFNFKPLQKQNFNGFQEFSEIVLESAVAFRNLNLPDPAGFILYTYGLQLLDKKTRELFESECALNKDIPDFDFFSNFMHRQFLQWQATNLTLESNSPNQFRVATPPKISKRVFMSTGQNKSPNLCPGCQNRHRLYHCPKFLAITPSERFKEVKRHMLCVNCLNPSHKSGKCTSVQSCKQCKQRHHSLLHFGENKSDKGSVASDSLFKRPEEGQHLERDLSSKPTSAVYSAASQEASCILLGTALARIRDASGRFHLIRMVIDSGAQRSFVTSKCAKRLGLSQFRNTHRLKGFSDTPIPGGKYEINCNIVPKDRLQPELITKAVVISSISKMLPSQPLPLGIRSYFEHLDLSDPTFDEPGEVDFLLGADLFGEIFIGERINTPKGIPNAFRTIFGWVILGPIKLPLRNSQSEDISLMALNEIPETKELEYLIQRFWEVEEVASVHNSDPLDLKCESHFVQTHFRDKTGRYGVRLPFKDNQSPLEDSHQMALQRLYRLEFKLNQNPIMRQEYSKLIEEHIQAGYVCEATEGGKYLLPHHGVIKDGALSKLRIVFDASAPTSNGSLNDRLLAGPKLQRDIRDILLNFRIYPIALTADIGGMYLQILVHPEDRAYQHFLYRFERSDLVKEYELTRVTFGLSCSPFLALRVIQQLIQDEGSSYPLASEALETNVYIDDILTGAYTIEEAQDLQNQLISLLNKGHFILKRWGSNSTELLQNVPKEDCECPISLSDLEGSSIKILGMQWDPSADCLLYKVQTMQFIPTKRGIMSAIARMYDPLGYLSPVIFKAKTILQELWKNKINWDDQLQGDLLERWRSFFYDLAALKLVRIPRCVIPRNTKNISIIGFADASTQGYATVIYLRAQTTDHLVDTHLIYSKTRLAPLKTLSIPRLELCAVLLLAQALKFLDKFLSQFSISSVWLITDSTIAISWLRTPPHKLRTFVANRVVAILNTSSIDDWYHVRSEDNAADLASRGTLPSNLIEQTAWWKGPDWLQKDSSHWPVSKNFGSLPVPEMKTEQVAIFSANNHSTLIELMERFSSFGRLVRVFSYMRRFIFNCRTSLTKRKNGWLTLSEQNMSRLLLIKATQSFYFCDKSPLKNPSIQPLSPFYNEMGILKVGGRLANSPLTEEEKHPILLPRKAHLTNLIVDHYHRIYLHAGPQLLSSLLNRRYWIISSRRVIRSQIHKCIICKRFQARTYPPVMSDLPSSRFAQGRPFINTGIDFAGPFITKESSRRKAIQHKSYVCLFVCLSSKAVHLELVSQLTTSAFLASLDRFVGRRGLPTKILSDHGTNFVGANKALKELYTWFKSNKVQDEISGHLNFRQVSWEFIPPAAPHFGGIWEAGVKSFKYHFLRVIKGYILTHEEFSTLLVRIEAVLNSRPLHPISPSPSDMDTLTPGHFLIGGPLLAVPEYDYAPISSNLLTRWQLINKCTQDIWKRWRLDYLQTLQARGKWRNPNPNIKCGTLVLLKEPGAPPLSWPTGRVTEVFPGPDGVVRVVKIKTHKGEYVRSVIKLVPLLQEEE